MSKYWLDDGKAPISCNLNSCSDPFSVKATSHSSPRRRQNNVSQLLAWREISPRAKRMPKRSWGETSKWRIECTGLKFELSDARQFLISWVEAQSLRHLSANYCPLLPPPRSTIAAAFSFNGKTLASTHGDHTVKIIDCQTGKCLKVLSGHRRTPWVVRFHPRFPEILASGSLDHEVRLWDANTADCIGSRDFYRPIASIAFHAQGELLAVASGHKLYIWEYNGRGETSSPTIVLRTKRSLRAVHFHPHAAPFLLTAEVNDLDSPDTPLTLATTSGYLQYPPPAVFVTNVHSSSHPSAEVNVPPASLLWPAFLKEDGRAPLHEPRADGSSNFQRAETYLSIRRQTFPNVTNQRHNEFFPMEMSPGEAFNLNQFPEEAGTSSLSAEIKPLDSFSVMETVEADGGQSDRNDLQSSGISDASNVLLPSFDFNGLGLQFSARSSRLGHRVVPGNNSYNPSGSTDLQMLLQSVDLGQLHQFIPSGDPACWELPFLQGWLMGQSHAGLHSLFPTNNLLLENLSGIRGMWSDVLASDVPSTRTMESSTVSLDAPTSLDNARGTTRSGTRHRSRSRMIASGGSGESIPHLNVQSDVADSQSAGINVESEIAASISADTSTDLPCTVKLRIWTHDIQHPSAFLDVEKCRLTIPHAVLCSEMGAHFSPCGRFLAACVACALPHMEIDPGLHPQSHMDITEPATSPTRHPISGHRIIYELRIYSLEEATFGQVLASRAIRAAHCLTSIQFSPTSEHILLAYGRRHVSLLRSCVTDGESKMHIYTILEVYRVSDMELVRVLPSAEDEVNVACFHPSAGCGLVYGTKEGKLRILQYDGPYDMNSTGLNIYLEEHMPEVPRYALEC